MMNERVNQLPHRKILECYFDPKSHRGELGLILAEVRRKEFSLNNKRLDN